jgi:hypothetical protein
MSEIARSFLFAIGIVGVYGCASVEEQWLYVDRARLQEASRHRALSQAFVDSGPQRLPYDDKEFVVTGHRIANGEGLVLALRSFDPGVFWAPDQAGFLKMTVFLPFARIEPGSQIHIPDSKGAMAYLSTGSSSFPGGNGCFGYASKGTINIDEIQNTQLKVSLSLSFRTASPLGFSGQCDEKVVRGQYVVPRVDLSKLTPWQGIAGKSVHEEAVAR